METKLNLPIYKAKITLKGKKGITFDVPDYQVYMDKYQEDEDLKKEYVDKMASRHIASKRDRGKFNDFIVKEKEFMDKTNY